MEARELHKKKAEAQLHEWSAKIDVMKAQADKMTAQARLDMKPTLDGVQAKFDAAKAKLGEIASATDDKWTETVKDVDNAWEDLKSAAAGAFDAIKGHDKH